MEQTECSETLAYKIIYKEDSEASGVLSRVCLLRNYGRFERS